MSLKLDRDFSFEKINLTPNGDGELHATFISSKENKNHRDVVLFIHGYIDYFFHPHVTDEFHKNHFDFYALDLRRYGRSLMSHQKPNYCKSIDEYFEEITIALNKIQKQHKNIYLLGHSTGGLIASCYMNRGEKKKDIKGLILNSPFLDMAQSGFLTGLLYVVVKPLSILLPDAGVSKGLSPVYAESLHKNYHGEWDFNLDWKPIYGYPVYFKWFVAIVDAQRSLRNSMIDVPILVLHARNSIKPKRHVNEVYKSDAVLDVDDMRRLGPGLGGDVTLKEIENGVHDLFLSSNKAKEKAFEVMFQWINSL